MACLYYQGHGSYRITTDDGKVIYVDPYAGDGYDKPADLILVTHQHRDHNAVDKVKKAVGCIMIDNQDALKNGEYQTFDVCEISVRAVPAYNEKHKKDECVGYLLSFDGLTLYAAGDTSQVEELINPPIAPDYALVPIDGIYNMGPSQAAAYVKRLGAKKAIPIHMKPGALFDESLAVTFDVPSRWIVRAGESIDL